MEKIALVTGSTSNVGKAIAETLSREDYHVTLLSQDT
jgi:short-subunit dehydrogenase